MNNICHVEIPIIDVEKCKQFYGNVFDWKIDFDSIPNYGLANMEEVSIGFPIVENIEFPERQIYIQVDDIEIYLKKIEELNGNVHAEKSLISDSIGFGAKFGDCFGNIIGLFSPS